MLWRVWVHGDEIYLAPRGMAQLVKLSLHSSGIWRWAWVKDSVLDEELEGDRTHERWLKPGPFIPGWIVGPSVMFLWSPVEGWEGDPIETTKRVSWLDPPEKNDKVTVSLMLAEPGAMAARDLREEKRFPLLAELHLRSGGRVWVAARRDPMTLEEMRGVAAVQKREVDANVVGFGGTAFTSPRAMGHRSLSRCGSQSRAPIKLTGNRRHRTSAIKRPCRVGPRASFASRLRRPPCQ